MAAQTVKCAKLGQDLPGLDPDSADGRMALKMVTMIGGRELAERVRQAVSARAWDQWKNHMVMVINEYRLDPIAPESNKVLRMHMEAFFFGDQKPIDNYVPPKS